MRRIISGVAGLGLAVGLALAGPATASSAGSGEPARERVVTTGTSSERVATVSADCFDYRGAVAGFGYKNWVKSTSDCAVFGRPGWRVGYAWTIPPGSNSRICVQGKGFRTVDGRTKTVWRNMGCGTSGSGTVPWGNRAATPQVRAFVQPGFLGGAYSWRH